MPDFEVVSPYEPSGDQPEAIDTLVQGLENGIDEQVLLGVTGSGKTYTMAKVIERVQRPTLVLAHNKIARGAAVQRVQGVFPEQRRGVFRLLLRLLPAGGVHPAHRHVHRKGRLHQR